MAEFKRLSDVNAIEAMSAQTNVLIEENGEIVKLAANSMVPDGVVTRTEMEDAIANIGGGGVSSWNDLTDKPFYSEEVENPLAITQETINNATESVDVDGIQLKKVSDDAYSLEDLIGSTLIMRMEGEEYSEVVTEDCISDLSEIGVNGLQIGEFNILSIFEDSEIPFDTPVSITKGLWVMDASGYGVECEFYLPTHKIKKLSADLVERHIKNLCDSINGHHALRTIGAKEESEEYEMGSYAFAEGSSTKASGYTSHAEGSGSIASSHSSHAEGAQTIASGNQSHAEGLRTVASGYQSHAEGELSIASGACAHAEGGYLHLNDFSIEISGESNVVTYQVHTNLDKISTGDIIQYNGVSYVFVDNIDVDNSTITVSKTLSSDPLTNASVFLCFPTKATGYHSHAEGSMTVANGANSHSEGFGTIAGGHCQHVQGKFNIPNDYLLHIVGNGVDKDNRSNAHTLDVEGNAWYQGTVEGTAMIVKSSTAGSEKRFKITVDDNGTISAIQI